MSRLVAKLPQLNPEFVVQALSEVYDWGLIDLHIPDIHQDTMGEGVKVCIIDSGLSEHHEVQHAIVAFKNFTSEPEVRDHCGHSTFVSGIIAAAKNSDGIIGVAPNVRLYFAKAMDKSGTGDPSALVNATHWAVDQGVDLISISAGMFFDFKPLHEAIKRAYNKNIIIIAAAGNSGERFYDIAFPARYPEVIGVGAYDRNRQAASFSSRGLNVKCAMPGVDVFSTWLEQQYCKNNGTSFAAPMLTGICALILARQRKLGAAAKSRCDTPSQLLEQLSKFAVRLGDPKATGFGTLDVVSLMREL